jgi:tetratricopeptide (TPR) repeat protein
MADIHITRELLLGVHRGELSARVLMQIGLQHLLSLCPLCRREFERFRRDTAGHTRADAALASATFGTQVIQLERNHRQAKRDLRDLLKLPQEDRAGRIRRSRGRFRGSHLALLLLEESDGWLFKDPREAFHFSELAHVVMQQSPFDQEMLGVLTLSVASMANASRAVGDRRGAEGHFRHARYLVREHSVTDAAILARIDDLEGSLRKDQRRLPQAEELLTRAVMLYQLADSRVNMARALVNLGATYNLQGKLDQAVEVTRAALQELSPEREPRLYMNGRYNLALFLVESGEPEQAAEVLDADADLYKRYPEPWVQLRLTGLRGKIAQAQGDFAAAETAFLQMRDGFLQEGVGYDAAIVSMDLALLYLRQGRTAELKALAREMLPIFRSQDVHREAVAALALFQEAVREEQITAAFVREIAAYLDAARTDPALRFRQSP